MSNQFDPSKHHHRSIRLRGYDYTQPGAYFITLCTNHREALFRQVQDGVMHPSRLGEIVQRAWKDLPNHYPHVILDTFCLMPDHVHGIIRLAEDPRGGGSAQDQDSASARTSGSEFSTIDTGGSRLSTTEIPSLQDSLKEIDSVGEKTRPQQGHLEELDPAGEQIRPNRPIRHGLPEIVRAFKSFSARRINLIRRTPGLAVWQRDYYEHIIRNEEGYQRISAYILANPSKWRGRSGRS